jgi:hypothetical protein
MTEQEINDYWKGTMKRVIEELDNHHKSRLEEFAQGLKARLYGLEHITKSKQRLELFEAIDKLLKEFQSPTKQTKQGSTDGKVNDSLEVVEGSSFEDDRVSPDKTAPADTKGCGRMWENELKGYTEQCGYYGKLCPECRAKEGK